MSPAFLAKVLEPAFALAPDFTLRPHLADATYTKTPPFVVTYRIHPGARWSDGVPVTARDFVFTHEATVEHLPPELQHPHDLVRSVRPVGAKTVRVVLRERTADWRTLFSRVLPEHALKSHDLEEIWSDGIENPRTGAPIGSGSFLLSSWDRGKQLILARNPRYWGPHTAFLDRIVIRIGPGGHPWLGKPLVRQALAYGIDREAIARAALELVGKPDPRAEPLDSVVFLANSRYYRPSWNRYRYRPALAQKLLERAGCRRGLDGIFICGEEPLSLRLGTSAGSDRRKRTLELAQASLRKVGVEIIPEYFHPAVWGESSRRGSSTCSSSASAAARAQPGPWRSTVACNRPTSPATATG